MSSVEGKEGVSKKKDAPFFVVLVVVLMHYQNVFDKNQNKELKHMAYICQIL